jgi:hypothetical protein
MLYTHWITPLALLVLEKKKGFRNGKGYSRSTFIKDRYVALASLDLYLLCTRIKNVIKGIITSSSYFGDMLRGLDFGLPWFQVRKHVRFGN